MVSIACSWAAFSMQFGLCLQAGEGCSWYFQVFSVLQQNPGLWQLLYLRLGINISKNNNLG